LFTISEPEVRGNIAHGAFARTALAYSYQFAPNTDTGFFG
jgi:hypothetical protein